MLPRRRKSENYSFMTYRSLKRPFLNINSNANLLLDRCHNRIQDARLKVEIFISMYWSTKELHIYVFLIACFPKGKHFCFWNPLLEPFMASLAHKYFVLVPVG